MSKNKLFEKKKKRQISVAYNFELDVTLSHHNVYGDMK